MALIKGGIGTEVASGRYPFWKYFTENTINLNKNLGFASDMRITLFNTYKSLIFREV